MSEPALLDTELNDHLDVVVRSIRQAKVVPFLGAGVNLCGRADGYVWEKNKDLPSGAELADYLAEEFNYPQRPAHDLGRVSQFVSIEHGSGMLYDSLRRLFNCDYSPTAVHRLLAEMPKMLQASAIPAEQSRQLIVTTNYDEALEDSFRAAGEPFDVVWYDAEGTQKGKFWHQIFDAGGAATGDPIAIDKPNEYRNISLSERSTILKIHGAVVRNRDDLGSYVITEDHYIEYLTQTDVAMLVPVTIAAKLKTSRFLFLGYSLSDWNLRVILHRMWGQSRLKYKSWAVQRPLSEGEAKFDKIESKFWEARDVDVIRMNLQSYVDALRARF